MTRKTAEEIPDAPGARFEGGSDVEIRRGSDLELVGNTFASEPDPVRIALYNDSTVLVEDNEGTFGVVFSVDWGENSGSATIRNNTITTDGSVLSVVDRGSAVLSGNAITLTGPPWWSAISARDSSEVRRHKGDVATFRTFS